MQHHVMLSIVLSLKFMFFKISYLQLLSNNLITTQIPTRNYIDIGDTS